jgi:hypothetical protein
MTLLIARSFVPMATARVTSTRVGLSFQAPTARHHAVGVISLSAFRGGTPSPFGTKDRQQLRGEQAETSGRQPC